MAKTLRAPATRWQWVTSTYVYEIEGGFRAREKRAWQREAQRESPGHVARGSLSADHVPQ